MGDAPAEWPPVSVEEIVSRAPDVVLVAVASADETVLDRVRSMPGLRQLDAVRGDGVRVLDASLFNRPGPGLIRAVGVLARAIHPEAFAP
jgi:iron complex transport system substrate-binding protein